MRHPPTGRLLATVLALAAGLLLGHALTPVRAADPTPLTPKLVTLRATTLPAAHLAQITKQTNIAFVTSPEDLLTNPKTTWDPVQLDLTAKPFWEATRELALKAKLTTGGDARPDRVRLWKVRTTSEFEGPSASQGPILIVATSLRRTKALPTVGSLQIRAFIDPGANVYAHSQQVEIESLVDAANHPVTPALKPRFAPPAQALSPMTLGLFTSVRTPEDLGDAVTLKGSARFLLPTGVDTTMLPLNKIAGTTKSLAGLRISVQSYEPADDRARLSLTVQRGDFPKNLWTALTTEKHPYLQLALLDKNNRLLPAPMPPLTVTDDTFQATFSFAFAQLTTTDGKKFDPDRLRLEAPTGTKELVVPLDLQNIPVVTTEK